MAQSAFLNIGSGLTSGSDNLIQKSADQFDPNYNTNLAIIEEADALKVPDTKLAIKAQNLGQKLIQKSQSAGVPVRPEPKGNDSLVRLLGSAALTTGADIADSAVELGANIVGKTAEVTGLRDYYTEEDQTQAENFLDPYTEAKFGDEVTGYDRSNYAQTQQNVASNVEQGNYGEAFLEGLTVAPELFVESLPYMATLGVGGRLKAVTQAGKLAKAEAAALGATKAQQKVRQASAVKDAEKALTIGEKLANVAYKNVGLVTMSATQTKNQNEEFKKNNNGEGFTALQSAQATALNVVLNGLDRGIFNNIIGLKNNTKDIKALWGQVSKAGKKTIAKKAAGVAADMGKEGGQEFLQEFGQIINENVGADGTTLTDVLTNKGNIDQSITAGLLGAAAGGMTSAPKTAIGVAADLNAIGKEKRRAKVATSTVEAGYKDAKTQTKHQTKVTADYDTAKQTFETLEEVEKEIEKINKDKSVSDTERVNQLQQIAVNSADDVRVSKVQSLGTNEVNDLLTSFTEDKALANTNGLKETLAEIKKTTTTPLQTFNLLIGVADQFGDTLPTEIKTQIAEARTSLDKQAKTLVKEGSTNITYENVKNVLNETGTKLKDVSTAIDEKGKPSNKPLNIDAISKQNKKTQFETLSNYDNATLVKLQKEAKAQEKVAKIAEKAARNNSTGGLAQALNSVKGSPVKNSAKQLQATISKIQRQRNTSKKVYDPRKSPKEVVENFITQAKKAFSDILKKPKDKRSAEDKQTVSNVKKAIGKAASNVRNLSIDTLLALDEGVTFLQKAGEISVAKAEALRNRFATQAETLYNDDTKTTTEKVKDVTKEATEKVKEKVKEVKESETTEKVVADSKQVLEAVKEYISDIPVGETFANLVTKVKEANYQEMYDTIKELGTLKKNNHSTSNVDKIVDSNGKIIVELGDC